MWPKGKSDLWRNALGSTNLERVLRWLREQVPQWNCSRLPKTKARLCRVTALLKPDVDSPPATDHLHPPNFKTKSIRWKRRHICEIEYINIHFMLQWVPGRRKKRKRLHMETVSERQMFAWPYNPKPVVSLIQRRTDLRHAYRSH